MKEATYIIGRKVAGGYLDGRYVCTKLTGQVHDYFIVKAVLEYPPIRAVANDEAWSGATVQPYGKLYYFHRGEMSRHPDVYEGYIGTTEEDYDLSLVAAIERSIEEYKAKGDMEAVDKLRERLQAAAVKVQRKTPHQSANADSFPSRGSQMQSA